FPRPPEVVSVATADSEAHRKLDTGDQLFTAAQSTGSTGIRVIGDEIAVRIGVFDERGEGHTVTELPRKCRADVPTLETIRGAVGEEPVRDLGVHSVGKGEAGREIEREAV